MLLAVVDLRREPNPERATQARPMRVVEHVMALVFDGGAIVSAVVGRSMHVDGHLLRTDIAGEHTTLSPSERADVLATTGVVLTEGEGVPC